MELPQVTDASLPAAMKHPLEMDDLLSEILLRLPPQPSSLPRARAVSKHWRSLASDAGFCARFRAHHRRRNPPLLGCFLEDDPIYLDPEEARFQFQPALHAPNRVPKGRFTFPIAPDAHVRILGCRHGLVLVINDQQDQFLVWDPVTGDQHCRDIPPAFDRAVVNPVSGAVLRAAAGDDLHHFQVVLVGRCDPRHAQEIIASIYSSSTGAWGNLVSTPVPHSVEDNAFIYPSKPSVMVGNSLYWLLMGYPIDIVEFDLDCSSLALIPTPGEISADPCTTEICVIPARGGGLGYLFLSGFDAQLWKRKTNCDGIASWVLGRVISLDKLLIPINSDDNGESLCIIGVAEENDTVLLRSSFSTFTVHLESLESKKIFPVCSYLLWPFEGVYTAEKHIDGGHDGVQNV